MSRAGNYLTRLAAEERRHRTRQLTSRPGMVYYLRRGVRGYSSQACRMTDISEGGCHVRGLLPSQVPEFLYLVLDGLPVKFPCAVVGRSDIGLHLRFMVDQPSELIRSIASSKFSPKTHDNDS